MLELNKFYCGDCLEMIKDISDDSIDLILTSPPYKNSYEGIGINRISRTKKYHYSNDVGEPLFVIEDVAELLFSKLKIEGCFLLNLGFNKDSGALRPFQIVDRFRRYGWFCPDIIIWHKTNPIPNTACQLTNSYEFIFVLTKVPGYKLQTEKREYIHNLFNTPVESGETEHSAAFHMDVAKFCILNFTKENAIVLDPFMGSGTTGIVARQLNRNFIGIEINLVYCKIAEDRVNKKMEGRLF